MQEKFHEVILKRIEPMQYVKQLNIHRSDDLYEKGSYYDNQYHRSQVFYEKIETDFWLFVHESAEKVDTCYVMPTKTSKTRYFSINYYQSKAPFSYQISGNVISVNDVIIFSSPESTYKIFVKRGATVKCHRLIFSEKYIRQFLDITSSNIASNDVNIIIGTGRGAFARPIHDIEKILIDKLYFQLKHNRGSFNYGLSITANAFNITDSFFRISAKQIPGYRVGQDHDLMNRILQYLEENVRSKFPGIDSLASDFYVSPTKLKDDFKKTFDTTPLIYFRKLQMSYAQERMLINNTTVKELAFELGFKKVSTFSLWFKRYIGMNPNELRNK